MRSFLYPANRPPHKFDSFQPVHSIDTMKPLETFTHDLPTTRRTLHCPKRTIWCGGERVHALVFAPTHEYWYSSDKWIHKSKMNASVGETFDFFVNQGGSVYYAGIYKVHSLRTVHPPGAKITSDVSRLAIHRATGLSLHSTEDKVAECFPDGEIRTECFGLQCVGFDQTLYEGLYARFRIGRQNKRKAESEDLQADTRFKSQRVSY
ncbi:hypothetical protein FB451DRAFT_646788 [Mycena latifolia]|nr:hypothetical protein FB451DRAFT_646788 [Mycena latifolia]